MDAVLVLTLGMSAPMAGVIGGVAAIFAAIIALLAVVGLFANR